MILQETREEEKRGCLWQKEKSCGSRDDERVHATRLHRWEQDLRQTTLHVCLSLLIFLTQQERVNIKFIHREEVQDFWLKCSNAYIMLAYTYIIYVNDCL
jgi:hypothetical protein